MSTFRYRPRLIDPYLDELRQAFPAVLLTGARATGKTTTARQHVDTVVRLDRFDEAGAFRAAPDETLAAQTGSVLLDEWQEVPEVLGAVKRAVDSGAEPGRFLLAGSVRARLNTTMWPGTGRVLHACMYPMTVDELADEHQSSSGRFLDLLFARQVEELPAPTDPPDLPGYLEMAVTGGFPEATDALPRARGRWLSSYLEQVFTRDTSSLGEHADPRRMQRLFEAVAANTAGLVADTDLARVADMNVKTLKHYQQMLLDLGLLDSVPAWFHNRTARLVKAPKHYITDPGLAASALGVDVQGLLRDSDLLGRILDTFVAAQLRPLLQLYEGDMRMYHLRQREGRHEVDLILENRAGQLVGIEIKASAGPSTSDARHLAWLRDELDDRFIAGIVLHTGKWPFPLGERITAVPIATLWSLRG